MRPVCNIAPTDRIRCCCCPLCPLPNAGLSLPLPLGESPVANIAFRLNREVNQRGEVMAFFFHDMRFPLTDMRQVALLFQYSNRPLRNEKSHFEWWRSPHVVFGHCPGFDGLRSTGQLSFKPRRKRGLFETVLPVPDRSHIKKLPLPLGLNSLWRRRWLAHRWRPPIAKSGIPTPP